MALTFVQSNASDSSNTVALTGVGAGNLIVLWIKWEDSASGGCTVSDGTSSLTMGTLESPGSSGPRGQFAYLLSANSGNKTYTVTWPSGALFKRLRIAEYSYSGTASLDVQNIGTGNSAAPLSGNVTTTGTDEVVLGGYAEYSGETPSAFKVNGAAAGGTIGNPANFAMMWYSIFTGTLTNTNAGCTLSAGGAWVCNIIAFKAVSGGTAHPYTGGAGVGAITQDSATQRVRGIARALGGAQAYGASTIKARSKVPTLGGGYSLDAATLKARGKNPLVGGSQTYDSGTIRSRGKYPVTSGAYSFSGATERSKGRSYIGNGVLVFSNGAERIIGRVYAGDGALHFSAGTIYSKSTVGATAYSYTGLASGSIVYSGATLVLFNKSYIEKIPVTVWTLEGKPADGYVLEARPSLPGSQDGAYTDPSQDGAWTDFPEDGAYTKIGYEPEFPPPNRYTTSVESKPSNTYAREGKP